MPNGTADFDAAYERGPILGRGASGIAFLVRPKSDPHKRLVAKELCVLRSDDKRRKDAFAESQLLRTLSHRNIVACTDVFQDEEMMYIVMEYADGGDLSKRIQMQKAENRCFSEQTVMATFVQICSPLDYLHGLKIMHRDLKPQNVFVVGDGALAECTIKLGDFGIAKMIEGTMGQANSTVGTPSYLSPEICRNNPYGMRSDIWSLGVMLYELACLRVPFHAGNLPAMALMICTSEPQPVPEEFSPTLAELVKSLLQKDPAKRPSTSVVLQNPYVQRFLPEEFRGRGEATAQPETKTRGSSVPHQRFRADPAAARLPSRGPSGRLQDATQWCWRRAAESDARAAQQSRGGQSRDAHSRRADRGDRPPRSGRGERPEQRPEQRSEHRAEQAERRSIARLDSRAESRAEARGETRGETRGEARGEVRGELRADRADRAERATRAEVGDRGEEAEDRAGGAWPNVETESTAATPENTGLADSEEEVCAVGAEMVQPPAEVLPTPPGAEPPASSGALAALYAAVCDTQPRMHRLRRRGRPPLLTGQQEDDPRSPLPGRVNSKNSLEAGMSPVEQQPLFHSSAPLARPYGNARGGVEAGGSSPGEQPNFHNSAPLPVAPVCSAAARSVSPSHKVNEHSVSANRFLLSSGSAPSLPPLPPLLVPGRRSRSVVALHDARGSSGIAHMFRTAPLACQCDRSDSGGGQAANSHPPVVGPLQQPVPPQRQATREERMVSMAPKLPTALAVQAENRHWREQVLSQGLGPSRPEQLPSAMDPRTFSENWGDAESRLATATARLQSVV
mmetsp:Transcript_1023/g.2561  ORF Transcript_1023/g.2561 Transcript_1023/m.2561 type:complete len:795 (-) Transcript_1023:164-2548(-)